MREQQQRYEALATSDQPIESDEDEDFEEVDGQTVAEAAAAEAQLPVESADDDLLDFSISRADPVSTPLTGQRGSSAALSTTSASWVEEMNAELAEFDALTAQVGVGGASPGGAWEKGMEAELQSRLVSPQQR